jgi:2-polyprenyl-6-methoxyphenol hydroxylase-like FAD-dependent oxidoreductase
VLQGFYVLLNYGVKVSTCRLSNVPLPETLQVCLPKLGDSYLSATTRANEPPPGDGFSISYNIIRSFRNWPYMAKKNEEIAFHPYLAWHNNKGERVTEPVKLEISESNDLSAEDKEGPLKQIYRHSRPNFHLMLETQLEMIGMKVQYGKRALRYIDADAKQKKNASVELDTGEIMEADVIIAADGVGGHSTKAMLGREVPARSTGHAIYRAAFPIEIVLADPELAERFKLLPDGSPVAELWIG